MMLLIPSLLLLPTYIDENTISYDFTGLTKPTELSSWGLLVSTPLVRAEASNVDSTWTFRILCR